MDTQLILSITTVIISIVAILISVVQFIISNKQHLFERRLKNFLTIKGLISLFERNRKDLQENRSDPIFAHELIFSWLTNNTYLSDITAVMSNPLKQEYRKSVLIKLEDLEKVATENEYIFSNSINKSTARFTRAYKELLYKFYKYAVCMNSIEKLNNGESSKSNVIYAMPEEARHKLAQKLIDTRLTEYKKEINHTVDELNVILQDITKRNILTKISKIIKL